MLSSAAVADIIVVIYRWISSNSTALDAVTFCADDKLLTREVPAPSSTRNVSTCVDLVEDRKKATFMYFLSRNKVKSKQRKQHGYNNMYSSCSIALITNCMHKIGHTTIGVISIRQHSGDCSDLTADSLAAAVPHVLTLSKIREGVGEIFQSVFRLIISSPDECFRFLNRLL